MKNHVKAVRMLRLDWKVFSERFMNCKTIPLGNFLSEQISCLDQLYIKFFQGFERWFTDGGDCKNDLTGMTS